jgi:hypothetical protein
MPAAPTVFVSYSSSDAPLAGSIYSYLKNHGIRAIKAPEDIQPGQDWAGSITGMIESATHMVLIWTSSSMASKEVAKELTLAMQTNTVIIPFQVHDLAPEGAWRYHLANLHWLQAHSTDHETACCTLIGQITGAEPVDPPPPPTTTPVRRAVVGSAAAAPKLALLLSIVALLINLLALVLGIWFGIRQPALGSAAIQLVGGLYRFIPPFSMSLYAISMALAAWALMRRAGRRSLALSAVGLTLLQLLAYLFGSLAGILPR